MAYLELLSHMEDGLEIYSRCYPATQLMHQVLEGFMRQPPSKPIVRAGSASGLEPPPRSGRRARPQFAPCRPNRSSANADGRSAPCRTGVRICAKPGLRGFSVSSRCCLLAGASSASAASRSSSSIAADGGLGIGREVVNSQRACRRASAAPVVVWSVAYCAACGFASSRLLSDLPLLSTTLRSTSYVTWTRRSVISQPDSWVLADRSLVIAGERGGASFEEVVE